MTEMEGMLYLDHAGATLPLPQLLEEYFEFLSLTPLANPHSSGYLGERTMALIEESRELVLDHFGADPHEYSVVFTSGATASIKLLGDCFPWSGNSNFAYPYNSHTSILGLREYSPSVYCISSKSIHKPTQKYVADSSIRENQNCYSLLAIPGECNFSGSKYPSNMISDFVSNISEEFLQMIDAKHIRRPDRESSHSRWLWLLDASKLAATSELNLTKDYTFETRPDFVCCSFYKIFGFPTGIGALLLKKSVYPLLKKRYFGGGTFIGVVADDDWSLPSTTIHTHFEDGTLNYQGIAALKYGFRALARLGGMEWIQQHTFGLCRYLFEKLLALVHTELSNQVPIQLCEIYGNHFANDVRLQGSIITFNMRWADGKWIGFNEVNQLALENNIQIRTGCFCCIGGCQEALSLDANQVQDNVSKGRSCMYATNDIIQGSLTGAIRVSVGATSSLQDCDRFLQFLENNFLNKISQTISLLSATDNVTKRSDCQGIKVSRWPLAAHGLYLDRQFALRSGVSGKPLTLKSHPQLTRCIPFVDLDSNWMTIQAPGMKNVLVINYTSLQVVLKPLPQIMNVSSTPPSLVHQTIISALTTEDISSSKYESESEMLSSIEICFDCQQSRLISPVADEWFSEYLQQKCHLVVQSHQNNEYAKMKSQSSSFSNSGQFLLVSEESVKNLQDLLVVPEPVGQMKPIFQESNSHSIPSQPEMITEKSFRPNFVVRSHHIQPHEEDSWRSVSMRGVRTRLDHSGNQENEDILIKFIVTGPCARCTVINVNPSNGEKDPLPLRTLSKYRKDEKRNTLFGQYLEYDRDGQISFDQMSDWIYLEENIPCDVFS